MTTNQIEFLKHSWNLPGIRYFSVKTKISDWFFKQHLWFWNKYEALKTSWIVPTFFKVGGKIIQTKIKQHQYCHLPIISKLKQKNEKFKASLVQNAGPYLKIKKKKKGNHYYINYSLDYKMLPAVYRESHLKVLFPQTNGCNS